MQDSWTHTTTVFRSSIECPACNILINRKAAPRYLTISKTILRLLERPPDDRNLVPALQQIRKFNEFYYYIH